MKFVADKDQITTEVIVSHFGFIPTTAKRYFRQLTEFDYMEAHGGNKNRTYSKKMRYSTVFLLILEIKCLSLQAKQYVDDENETRSV